MSMSATSGDNNNANASSVLSSSRRTPTPHHGHHHIYHLLVPPNYSSDASVPARVAVRRAACRRAAQPRRTSSRAEPARTVNHTTAYAAEPHDKLIVLVCAAQSHDRSISHIPTPQDKSTRPLTPRTTTRATQPRKSGPKQRAKKKTH